jgi:hypothetical protein
MHVTTFVFWGYAYFLSFGYHVNGFTRTELLAQPATSALVVNAGSACVISLNGKIDT